MFSLLVKFQKLIFAGFYILLVEIVLAFGNYRSLLELAALIMCRIDRLRFVYIRFIWFKLLRIFPICFICSLWILSGLVSIELSLTPFCWHLLLCIACLCIFTFYIRWVVINFCLFFYFDCFKTFVNLIDPRPTLIKPLKGSPKVLLYNLLVRVQILNFLHFFKPIIMRILYLPFNLLCNASCCFS